MSTSKSPSKAEIMIATLDRAGDYLEIALAATKVQKHVADLNQALAQLGTTRTLLVKVKIQPRYQIDQIIDGLPAVAQVLDKLVNELGKGKPHAIRRVNNAIEELHEETKNLQSLLPGLYIEAVDNVQEQGGKFMNNAPMIKTLEKGLMDGSTHVARGNRNASGFQSNALIQADYDAVKSKFDK